MTGLRPTNSSLISRPRTRLVFGLWLAFAAAVVLMRGGGVAFGQTPPVFRRDVIVLDAAHGGSEAGAALATDTEEKDVTLEFAVRLRSLLAVRGFTVVMTRTGDVALSADQRAEAANRARAVACLVIHATASGVGVHLATSDLKFGDKDSGRVVEWDRAQAAYLDDSRRLADSLGGAVVRSQLPVVLERAALRPLNSLSCPAVGIELAPSSGSGSDAAGADDDDYQQQVAKAVAGALVLWRNQAVPPDSVLVRPFVGRGSNSAADLRSPAAGASSSAKESSAGSSSAAGRSVAPATVHPSSLTPAAPSSASPRAAKPAAAPAAKTAAPAAKRTTPPSSGPASTRVAGSGASPAGGRP